MSKTKIPFLYPLNTPPSVLANNIIDNINEDIKIFNELRVTKFVPDTVSDITKYNTVLKDDYLISPQNQQLFSYWGNIGVKGKIGTPYIFNYETSYLVFKQSNKITISVEVLNNVEDFKCLSTEITVAGTCLDMNFPKILVGSSEYVNEIIIGYFMNKIFFPSLLDKSKANIKDLCTGRLLSPYDLGYSVFQLGYFQSTKDNNQIQSGYNVMQAADGTIDKIFINMDEKFSIFKRILLYNNYNQRITDKDGIICHIMLQIIEVLTILTRYFDFFHGDLKAGNVFFSFNDNYLDNTLTDGSKSNIRIKIADYGKSAMSFGNKHFFFENLKPLLLLIMQPKNGIVMKVC